MSRAPPLEQPSRELTCFALALLDSIVCEEGHLLQGYVQESNETQEMSQHVTMSRRLRKKRAKRVKPLPNHYFHGERATFILWQSLQWVLREQLRVLIEELGWPTELEGVCRDLWAMLMASSGVPNAPSDHFKGDEPASSYCGPREGSRYAKSRKRSTKGKAEDGAEDGDDDQTDRGTGDEGRSEGGRRAGSGSEADADDSHSDVTSDESVAEDSEDDGVEPPDKRARRGSSAGVEEEPSRPSSNIYDKVKPPPVRDIKPQSRNPRAAPRMDHLLMIIYLGCTTLRYPVFLSDIIQQVDLLRIGDRFGPLSPILTLTLRARSCEASPRRTRSFTSTLGPTSLSNCSSTSTTSLATCSIPRFVAYPLAPPPPLSHPLTLVPPPRSHGSPPYSLCFHL